MATRLLIVAILHAALLVLPKALRGQTLPISPTAEPIGREQLEGMYRQELGTLYDGGQFQQVYGVHELLEQFFARPPQRKPLLDRIEATGVTPAVIGRLCRLRLYWPQLVGGVYYLNERVGPHDVHYFLGVPRGYDRSRPWPLVIKLAPAKPFVTQPPPTAEQVTQYYTAWVTEELTRHPDALVIMPLLNLDELYGPSLMGMNSVIQPLHHAADRVNIDPARVYLMGHAMSAHATWNLALHYPSYFAAIGALAGNAGNEWQRIRMINLLNLLPVMWHDVNDDVTKVEQARVLARILRNFKLDVDYEETKGFGHTPNDAIQERVYQKMRARVRELYPRRVALQSNRAETIFNRGDWLQIYQPLRPGDEQKMIIPRSTGLLVTHANTWKADATRGDRNRIDILTDNVESLRVYLNEQMVDFGEAVVVRVNRKTRFEGIVKPSVRETLKDQLFLGRGWRYHTAYVDVDFGATATTATTATRPTR